MKEQRRPPGFPAHLFLGNRCWDSVSICLKLYNPCEVPARQNDQAHYVHAPVPTHTRRPERAALSSGVEEKSQQGASVLSVSLSWFLACSLRTGDHWSSALSRAQGRSSRVWSRAQTTVSAFRVCWDLTRAGQCKECSAHVRHALVRHRDTADRQRTSQQNSFCI